MSGSSDLPDVPVQDYDARVGAVAAAAEDLHNRNLARLTVLAGDRCDFPADFANLKCDILLDLLVGGDGLERAAVSYQFQRRLATLITDIERARAG